MNDYANITQITLLVRRLDIGTKVIRVRQHSQENQLFKYRKYLSLNPQLHSRSATYIKRNELLIRKTAIKSSHPFQYAYHSLTP